MHAEEVPEFPLVRSAQIYQTFAKMTKIQVNSVRLELLIDERVGGRKSLR